MGPDTIAIPFEGKVHCPHCHREWLAKITPVLTLAGCRDLIQRLLDRMAVGMGYTQGVAEIKARQKHDWLTYNRKKPPQ